MKRFALVLGCGLSLLFGSELSAQRGPRGPRPSRDPNAFTAGGQAPDGTEIACDLPDDLHMKNVGGSDGAGLCVFTSLTHASRYQNLHGMEGFRKWMESKPGGGYPQKVDKMVAQYCQEKGIAKPPYVQIEGSDIEILKLASKTGRMPGITYSYSPTGRYNGQTISHMVNLVLATDKYFVVLDNNYVTGPKQYEWMSPDTFKNVYTRGGGGWSVIFLGPPPPPVPHN